MTRLRWAACVFLALFLFGLGLLIPAVQLARESARRSQCSSNLKQFGLALHNYHDVWKRFPPGYQRELSPRQWSSWSAAEEGNQLRSGRAGLSMNVALLPFSGHNELYQEIRFDNIHPTSGEDLQSPPSPLCVQQSADGRLFREIPIRYATCPSDTLPHVRTSPPPGADFPAGNWATCSYWGNSGNGYIDPTWGDSRCTWAYAGSGFSDFKSDNGSFGFGGPKKESVSGLFNNQGYGASLSEIIDGTSNTIALGEDIDGCSLNIGLFWGDHRYSGGLRKTTVPMNFFVNCSGRKETDRDVEPWGGTSGCVGAIWNPAFRYAFRSRHAQGGNFQLADGSTKYLFANMDENVWRALGGKADRRPIDQLRY